MYKFIFKFYFFNTQRAGEKTEQSFVHFVIQKRNSKTSCFIVFEYRADIPIIEKEISNSDLDQGMTKKDSKEWNAEKNESISMGN